MRDDLGLRFYVAPSATHTQDKKEKKNTLVQTWTIHRNRVKGWDSIDTANQRFSQGQLANIISCTTDGKHKHALQTSAPPFCGY